MPVISTSCDEITRITKKLGCNLGEFKGSGIFMSQQTYGCLKKGDHVWDGDFGYMVWDGSKWIDSRDVKERSK